MSADARDPGTGLVLRPFRATRYGPAVGDDLGTVTSPPYDVIDEETVGRLYDCHPYNVVRLIIPRRFSRAPSYAEVRDRLRQWERAGVLMRDDRPALYVYEYTVGDRTVRGLVGALGLRDRSSATVLPHEDVMSGPVEDRAELITSTATNLEPILLVYDGNGIASDLADAVTDDDRLFSAVAPDHSRHTVWRITDPNALQQVAADLAPRQALIADGHHRYAAYRQVQATVGGADSHFGLALLVDQQRYPLHLGPIHRVVSGIGLDDLVSVPADVATAERFGQDADGATRAAANTEPGLAAFTCTDGTEWLVVRAPRAESEIDTHALHERLLPALRVPEQQVRYVHDGDHAVQEARKHAGVALLVNPPSVKSVVAAAEQGRGLPRKSTSFGPKPRMGLLMRTLRLP
jgi:uncharacterized protein (DUF1015 family)